MIKHWKKPHKEMGSFIYKQPGTKSQLSTDLGHFTKHCPEKEIQSQCVSFCISARDNYNLSQLSKSFKLYPIIKCKYLFGFSTSIVSDPSVSRGFAHASF